MIAEASTDGTNKTLIGCSGEPNSGSASSTTGASVGSGTSVGASSTTGSSVAAGEKGLYYLEIEVPVRAPPGRHQGPQAGRLRLQFEHPRIPDLMLRVDFAVANRLVARSTHYFP